MSETRPFGEPMPEDELRRRITSGEKPIDPADPEAGFVENPDKAHDMAHAQQYTTESTLGDLNEKTGDTYATAASVTVGETVGYIGDRHGRFETKDGESVSVDKVLARAAIGHTRAEAAGAAYDRQEAAKQARIEQLEAELARLKTS